VSVVAEEPIISEEHYEAPAPVLAADQSSEYAVYQEPRNTGIIGRFVITVKELTALTLGGGVSYIRQQSAAGHGWALHVIFLRLVLAIPWIFLNKDIISQPFAQQFRIRLERLGPTYIKLGQILSLREDILPKAITTELSEHLLDKLPAVPTERYLQLVEQELGAPLETAFRWIDPRPLGSASLAQTHRARLLNHDKVVIKLLKPGVRDIIVTDTRLLRVLASFLQLFLGRFQPKPLINEFCDYTLREVDLRFEADNAEVFRANFKDEPDIKFPKIYPHQSTRGMLVMEYFRGMKPDVKSAEKLTDRQRRRATDLGVQAIIQMIFQDGFFHADLHPGNLVIFPDATVGFLDLGMVGRFDRDTRKRVFYYFYSLVTGDSESAARYLSSLTRARKPEDMERFRRALAELYGRWIRTGSFHEFSLAQVIMQSIVLAGRYYIQYPSEVILMVKALVTVEGVGNILVPDLSIAEASRGQVTRLMLHEFNPVNLLKESALVVPEMVEILNRSPLIISDGLKVLENSLNQQKRERRLTGQSATTLAGFALLSGTLLVALGGPWPAWVALFGLSGLMILLSLRR
jgi:ubiquinone biosynthesis protein